MLRPFILGALFLCVPFARGEAAAGNEMAAAMLAEIAAGLGEGTPEAQAAALQQYYFKLYNDEDRLAALAIATAIEPLLTVPEDRAEFQERVAGVARDAGDTALYETFQGRLEEENPDPTTEAGYHARYARALTSVQRHDFAAAAELLAPLLPVSEGISEDQRARIGVQLTNVYRNNGDYDKAITLAELTRAHLGVDDPRSMNLLADLAAAYFETGNYELAALTYDELAAAVLRLRPDAQAPEQPALWREEAILQAAESRSRAQALRPPAAMEILSSVESPAVQAPAARIKTSRAVSVPKVVPLRQASALPTPAADSPVNEQARWPLVVLGVATFLAAAYWIQGAQRPMQRR